MYMHWIISKVKFTDSVEVTEFKHSATRAGMGTRVGPGYPQDYTDLFLVIWYTCIDNDKKKVTITR